MSVLDLLFGAARVKPSEGLGGFDEREEKDLGLHVNNCARRYDDLRTSLEGVRLLLWIVIAILLASNFMDLKAILELFLL